MSYTKTIRSGSFVEIYRYAYGPSQGGVRKRGFRKRSKRRFSRRADNLYRVRRDFKRLARSNFIGDVPPALITLTMFERVRIDVAYFQYTKFISELRTRFGSAFRYIAVPEFQKTGRVHFHVLMWGLPYEFISREKQLRNVQRVWQRGFVDCVVTNGSLKLVGYLAKYMSKAMHDKRLLGQKAYISSRNALRPVSISSEWAAKAYEGSLSAKDVETVDKVVLHQASYHAKYMGTVEYKLILLKDHG